MTTKAFVLGIALSGGLLSAQAQEASSRSQQDSVKLQQKLDKLFSLLNTEKSYSEGVNSTIEQQLAAAPGLKNYSEDVKKYFQSCIGWAVIKPEITRLYLQTYTSEDLDQLIKFYQTPTGRKLSQVGGSIQKEVVKKEQENLQAHISEWNALVNKANQHASSEIPTSNP